MVVDYLLVHFYSTEDGSIRPKGMYWSDDQRTGKHIKTVFKKRSVFSVMALLPHGRVNFLTVWSMATACWACERSIRVDKCAWEAAWQWKASGFCLNLRLLTEYGGWGFAAWWDRWAPLRIFGKEWWHGAVKVWNSSVFIAVLAWVRHACEVTLF